MSAPAAAPDPAVANAELWAKFFQDQWKALLNPFGVQTPSPVAQLAEGTAARVSGFLSLLAAGPIAWLFEANAPQVSALARREAVSHRIDIRPATPGDAIEPAA